MDKSCWGLPMKLDFSSTLNVTGTRKDKIGIKYSMIDLTCDIKCYYAWSCDIGKVGVHDTLLIEKSKKRWDRTKNFTRMSTIKNNHKIVLKTVSEANLSPFFEYKIGTIIFWVLLNILFVT